MAALGPLPLALDRAAEPVNTPPGGEVVLQGALTSRHDGSVVDAGSTTWPEGSPGGAWVEPRGIIDWEAGGFRVTSSDPAHHEYHVVATDAPGVACQALGVASPCLPLRLHQQALSRLVTTQEWVASLREGGGGITVTLLNPVTEPAAFVPPTPLDAMTVVLATLAVSAGLLGLLRVTAAVLGWRRARLNSPSWRFLTLLRRLETRVRHADASFSVCLSPVLRQARRYLKERRFDAASPEGEGLMSALERVESELAADTQRERSAAEEAAAAELVQDLETALEVAREARSAARA